MRRDFMDAVMHRRSYYSLGDSGLADDFRVRDVIEKTLLVAPSPFNVQSARIVHLWRDAHLEFWDIVERRLRDIVPETQFASTRDKLHHSFRAGCGTILFYEDAAAHEKLRMEYPTYADKVEEFALQSSGMYQFIVWTAIEDLGYGASLQHYNPLIDEDVSRRWHLPASWQLIAQMPYGEPLAEPGVRVQKLSVEERMMVF